MAWKSVAEYAKDRGVTKQYIYNLIALNKIEHRKVKKIEVIEVLDKN